MKKLFIWILAVVIILGAGAYGFYKFYLPTLVADVLLKDAEPAYVPKFLTARIKKYKDPVNKGAEDVIREIHRSDVTLDQLIAAIDATEEHQVQAMLDEMIEKKPKTPNQVFDLARKHFKADFDIELLRKPFNENVDMDMIRQGLSQANEYRYQEGMDPDMAKAVIKQILIRKEKEYNRIMSNR